MATIHDVAEDAGVSPTTVSRYLNNRIELPAATAARIDASIAKLDYRPNLLAKRLSTGKTEAIGLVAPEIGNPFFAELAAAVEDEAESHGYAVFMSSTHGRREREIAALNRLADRHVDGLIMMTNAPDDGTLARLLAGHENVVLIDEDIPGVDVPRIHVDNALGGYLAGKHLIEMGHTRIGLIGGPDGLFSVNERRAGFEKALAEAGLSLAPVDVLLGDYTREFGHAAALKLCRRPDRPTAIFAQSDYNAIGILAALRELGLTAPKDLSIVGFDDMPFAELTSPALTTIRQPIAAMGRLGFQTLLALLNKREVAQMTRLPVELVIRDSVAPPPKD
ncbi:LacI family DNA-binding transcriptional regulator [Paradevosia shaoguanensis]|uniref:LacI family DNA-binding transcriptional regulator n=1 Tax=Paradevosia shaoguanensis TaxID=1335043 RepID=UPI003C7181E4